MATDLARAYRACARTTRRAARNFYFAFLSLPARQRRAIYALYAFCHEADCVADEGAEAPSSATLENGGGILPVDTASKHATSQKQASSAAQNSEAVLLVGEEATSHKPATSPSSATVESGRAIPVVDDEQGPPSAAGAADLTDLGRRRAELAKMRERLASAARGEALTERDRALVDTIARFGVREQDLADVLSGIEMDLEPSGIDTLDDLRTYCYYVASAVGLATLPVLASGAPPTEAMRETAIDLGLGMQYVNILRDVDEDLDLGRVYLPREELAAHGVDLDALSSRKLTDGLRDYLAIHAKRARAHLRHGRRLLADLPSRGRACPWLLSEIYGRILERIVAGGYRVFDGRASLPAAEKLWLLFSARWRRL